MCVPCPRYMTNAAGDDASGLDTACDALLLISEAGRNLTPNLYEALELYNNSSREMDLSGFSLYIFNGLSDTAFGVHTFGARTIIPAGVAYGIIEEIPIVGWRMMFPAQAAEIDLEVVHLYLHVVRCIQPIRDIADPSTPRKLDGVWRKVE